MIETELDLCPFCGENATLKREHDVFTDSYEGYIQCNECGARTKSIDIGFSSRESVAVPNPLNHLVKLWNMRKQ